MHFSWKKFSFSGPKRCSFYSDCEGLKTVKKIRSNRNTCMASYLVRLHRSWSWNEWAIHEHDVRIGFLYSSCRNVMMVVKAAIIMSARVDQLSDDGHSSLLFIIPSWHVGNSPRRVQLHSPVCGIYEACEWIKLARSLTLIVCKLGLHCNVCNCLNAANASWTLFGGMFSEFIQKPGFYGFFVDWSSRISREYEKYFGKK